MRGDHNGDIMVTMLQLAAAALLFSQLLIVYGASDEKEQEVAAVLRRMVRSKCYILINWFIKPWCVLCGKYDM